MFATLMQLCVDNLVPVIEKRRSNSNAPETEMMATERFKAAMAKEAARKNENFSFSTGIPRIPGHAVPVVFAAGL
jgi:hypothetical protein